LQSPARSACPICTGCHQCKFQGNRADTAMPREVIQVIYLDASPRIMLKLLWPLSQCLQTLSFICSNSPSRPVLISWCHNWARNLNVLSPPSPWNACKYTLPVSKWHIQHLELPRLWSNYQQCVCGKVGRIQGSYTLLPFGQFNKLAAFLPPLQSTCQNNDRSRSLVQLPPAVHALWGKALGPGSFLHTDLVFYIVALSLRNDSYCWHQSSLRYTSLRPGPALIT